MKRSEYNVCCVCTGNSIRSPFCEAVLKTFVENDPELCIEVWSCGTLDWGRNPRDEQMTSIAEAMGYKMEGETTYMKRDELLKADKIIVFTHGHRDEVVRVLDYSHWSRIVLFDFLAFEEMNEVEDPNYQSFAVYERVAKHIEQGCKNIVAKWKATGVV